MGPHAALALATSLSAYVNAALLFKKLKSSTPVYLLEGWLKYVMQVFIATLIMTATMLLLLPKFDQWLLWGGLERVGALLGFMLLGAVLYISALILLGVRKKIFVPQ